MAKAELRATGRGPAAAGLWPLQNFVTTGQKMMKAMAGVRASSGMSDFRKLDVWKEAHQLALECNRIAVTIRGAPYASLRSQIIRAAISVPANIVEGREQRTEKEFARFLRYSLGSASELEYHFIFAHDLNLISTQAFESLVERVTRVRKMLNGLISKLE